MKRLLRGVGSDRHLGTLRFRQGSACGLACLVTVLCLIASAHSQSNPGTYEVLHAFDGSPDGGTPASGLIRDTQGNLYGTTSSGGNTSATCSNSYCGVVFKIDSAGNETVLYSFNGQPDGSNPQAGLIQDAAGNLFGTTCGGGTTGNGTIFKIDGSGKETVLYSFAGQPDGSCPSAGLVLDSAGNLYGTTTNGGVSNAGTIFKLDTTGKETVLYSFTGQADGKSPQDLLRDSAGNLYGIANRGGVVNCTGSHGAGTGCGTIFKLDTTETFAVLYSFQGLNPTQDGGLPVGALVTDAAGNLYGATYEGGAGICYVVALGGKKTYVGCGTIFELDTSGNEKVLHSFVQTDGSFPYAGLAIDSSGNLYGTTSSNIFEVDTSGNLTVLYDFTGGNDGGNPKAPLLRDSSGNLYGTASSSSGHCPDACGGVVFELPAASSPVFNVVITFTGNGTGTVTSSPSGINCPPDCVSAFPVGTTVSLTAAPTGGSTFGLWTGALPGSASGCTTTNANVCTVNSTQALDAVFSPPPADFAISSSPFAPATINPGSTATSTISTTGTGGFSGSIALSCTVQSSIPFAPTCSVSPASVNAGISAKLTVNTTGPTAAMVSSHSGHLYAIWMPVLGLLLGGTGLSRGNRTHRLRLRLACLLVASALLQMACGGSPKLGSPGTPPGTYTIVVTASSGSLQHSVSPSPTITVQ